MGEVIQLIRIEKPTSQAVSIPVKRIGPNPQERISMAADQHMLDRVIEWAEARIAITNHVPLEPKDRRATMRMVAAIDPKFSPK